MIFKKPSSIQISSLARRIISSLPDSLSAQKSELLVLIEILPRNSDARKTAMEMLGALQLAEHAQKEFSFGSGGNPHHDGKTTL